jgi:hypothetical protein
MAPHDRPQLDHHPAHPHTNTTLDAASVEAVARRVVELMLGEGDSPSARGLVDAATLAAELGVERSWVYTHRDELGAMQLGTGPKPRLRFDVETARAVLARSHSKRSHEPTLPMPARSSVHRQRRRMGSGPPLLPVKGSTIPAEDHREHSR